MSNFNKLKFCHCIWFCTLLFYFGTRAYLFSPDEGSCYIFSTRNNCCEFLASYGVISQSVIQSFLKTPVCGASLSYVLIHANLPRSRWFLVSSYLTTNYTVFNDHVKESFKEYFSSQQINQSHHVSVYLFLIRIRQRKLCSMHSWDIT